MQNIICPKLLTRIQTVVCLLLLVVVVILSFCPIFTLPVKNNEDIEEGFGEFVSQLGENPDDYKLPKSIDISAGFVADSVMSLFKVGSSIVESAKEAEDGSDMEKTTDNAKEIVEQLKDEDFLNSIAFVLAIVNAFEENGILAFAYFALISLVFTIPLTLAIKLLITLISFFKNITCLEKAYPKVSRGFAGAIGAFPILLLIKFVVPNVEYTKNLTIIAVLCIVGVVFNAIAARFKPLTKGQTKYLNLLQFGSLGGLVAYVIFHLNAGKANIFNNLIGGVSRGAFKLDGSDFLLMLALCLPFISIFFTVGGYLKNTCCRAACMTSKCSFVASSVVNLFAFILPLIIMVAFDTLEFRGDEETAFWLYGLGLVLMLVCEIVMMSLKASLCSDVSDEEKDAVHDGAYEPVGAIASGDDSDEE